MSLDYNKMENARKRVENSLIRDAKKQGVSAYLMYKAIKERIVVVNPSIMDWMDSGFCDGGFFITWKEGWSRADLFTSVRLKDKDKYLRYRELVA
ncbi:hypothetical protein PQO01_06990 [Lentisphaera marina]|uniref:hypothetical protein n=1 Tax=Lentisphaera marina TaxID=1111041 RepID=UPI002365761E|nr:hypothetical protein [Lentisphaera marina]MDD7984692.1 hypothetical protein [Lentisphaera marina]